MSDSIECKRVRIVLDRRGVGTVLEIDGKRVAGCVSVEAFASVKGIPQVTFTVLPHLLEIEGEAKAERVPVSVFALEGAARLKEPAP